MPLIDDKFYPLSALATYPFSTTLLPGGDIEFELEEKKDDLWQVSSFDRNICKVKTEHDRNGFWPTDNRKCEVEIKALNPGNTVLILKNRSGQEVKINITVHATAGRH